MKILDGGELAEYIKERQAQQVRALRQAWGIAPKLAVVRTTDDPVISTYVRMKRRYGDDILIDVEVHQVAQVDAMATIQALNQDDSVHGIIVQLPLADPTQTEELVNAVVPEKDVDALGAQPAFDPATPMAISWLLAGYNVDLKNKNIVIIGNGRLVGAPLAKMWQQSGYNVTVVDIDTPDKEAIVKHAEIIVTATGDPSSLKSSMITIDAVVVDAGTASENGKVVGDLAQDVREGRDDLTLTPLKGGVGPLTICALFDNVIRSARIVADAQDAASSVAKPV